MSRSRRSERSSRQLPKLPPFFINRSLGRHDIENRLRNEGFDVRTLADVFGEHPEGQRTADPVWIRRCAEEGWAVLSKDRRSLCNQHRALIEELDVRTFIVPKAHMTARIQAERILVHRHRIARHAAKRGAGPIFLLHKNRIQQFRPRGRR